MVWPNATARIVVARPSEKQTSKLPQSGTASCLISHRPTLKPSTHLAIYQARREQNLRSYKVPHTAQANCAPFLTEIVRGDMGELVTINFRSRAIRTDRALEVKVRDCLKAFDQTGTYDAALKLCRTACPGCEVGLAQALPDGRWIVEVRYDNLLHEGEGETAAAALADAVLQISKTIEAEQI